MRIEASGARRYRLVLCALFAMSFTLTAVVSRPSIGLPRVVALAADPAVVPPQSVLLAAAGPGPMPALNLADQEAPAAPVATLLELAVSGDADVREEAQALMNALDAEAAYD